MFVLFTMAPDPQRPRAPHYRGYIFISRTTAFRKIPLDVWSARRRYRFMITHNTHKWETYTHLAGFETTIPLSKRRQTGNGVC